MSDMRTIRTEGQSKLVEFKDAGGRLRRTVIPLGADDPEHGIPYGDPFEALLPAAVVISGEQVADALHAVGIWTIADLRAHPNEAVGALNNITGATYSALLQAARRI